MNEKVKVALSSLLAAIVLTSMKFVVGIMTGSLGILSEALHSALDLVAALITYFSVRISDKPADHDHHYGHGKVENLSAFAETMLLLVTCVWIIYEAINRLTTGTTEIVVNFWSYFVVIVSIIIDISRSRALKAAAIKHNSQALEADALHFSTDIWSSAVVLVGLIFAQFGIHFADSVAALFVAGIVIYISIKLGIRSVNVLLDKVPSDIFEKVKDILDGFDSFDGYRDLRIRSSGADYFIDVTILFKENLSLEEAHDVSTAIEEGISAEIKRCNVHVHTEPIED